MKNIDKNKLGIYVWFGYVLPMKEKLKLIRDTGFNSVMIWWGDEFIDIDGDKYHHPDLVRFYDLYLENFHLPFEKINSIWEDNINGIDVKEMIIKSIKDASTYEVPTVVLHLSEGSNPPPINKIGLKRLYEIIDFAEKYNVNVALENLRKPERLLDVFKEINSDKLCFCYDSGHDNCYNGNIDILNDLGHKLVALHLHDNDGTDDLHRIPGEGVIDWNLVLEKLRRINFNGIFSLEVSQAYPHPKPYETPERFLKKAYDSVKKLHDKYYSALTSNSAIL